MKALENRALASQKEMADLDNLDEIKAMNMKHLKIMASAHGTSISDALLSVLRKEVPITEEEDELNENGFTKEEEAMVRNIKFGKSLYANDDIRRLGEIEEEEAERLRKRKEQLLEDQQNDISKKAKSAIQVRQKRPIQPVIVVKKRLKKTQPQPDNSPTKNCLNLKNGNSNGLNNLLGVYGSSSEDSN